MNNIKTRQERQEDAVASGHFAGFPNEHMAAEIADLRAALASQASNGAVPEAARPAFCAWYNAIPSDQLTAAINAGYSDVAWLGYQAGMAAQAQPVADAAQDRNTEGPLLIARIKRYRDVFGCTLAEAKEAVEYGRDMNADETEFIKPPRQQEIVAYAVMSSTASIHKLSIRKGSADRKAAAWREQWPNNAVHVRGLVFADGGAAQPSAAQGDDFAKGRVAGLAEAVKICEKNLYYPGDEAGVDAQLNQSIEDIRALAAKPAEGSHG